MKRVAALVLVAVSAVHAEPRPSRSWADWVGDYRGPLRWSPRCTAAGAPAATLALDATDGAITLDLAPAGGGLRAMSLVEDGTGWTGQQGDVQVKVTQPRANALAVTVTLESGCTMRGTLARASVGVSSCDQLVAWTRIEAACTKRTQPALEDPATIAKERTTWKARTKLLAASCQARGEKLRTALVDVGCAPLEAGLDAPHCRALLVTASRLAQCKMMSPKEIEVFTLASQNIASVGQRLEPAQRDLADSQCEDTIAQLREVAAARHCTL